MINWFRARIRDRRNAARYPDVRLGARTSVHESALDPQVALGDDTMVLRATVGRYSYLGPRCIVADTDIGQFCSIAADVAIGSGGHPLERNVAIHPMFYLNRPPHWDLVSEDRYQEFRKTSIGNDVWIGTKAVIRDGIKVGHGAVIGAGAIVTKDLEPYGIYAGSPARLIRYRFDEATRKRLLALSWWDRDMTWIRSHAAAFSDVGELLTKLSDGQ